MHEALAPVHQPVDLDNCAREPIHIPGSIQPHGVLLAVDPASLRLVQWSENAPTWLGIDTDDLTAYAFSDLVDTQTLARIEKLIHGGATAVKTPLMAKLKIHASHGFHLGTAHVYEGVLIVEFQVELTQQILLHTTVEEGTESITRCVQRATARMHASNSQQELFAALADEVRQLTGYDRVMIYRFMADQHGVVEGEALRDGLESYLGLHYPASDIPPQARRLYTLNLIRVIADLNATPVPLEPQNCPLHGRPLDLTYSSFRSVSPIHIEYLRNMGVAASMSISILNDGQLWGLIACHHYQPRDTSLEIRAACELLGTLAGSYVTTRQIRDEIDIQNDRQIRLSQALRTMAAEDSIDDGLRKIADQLIEVVDAQGVAIYWHGRLQLHGVTPPREFVDELCEHLAQAALPPVWSTDQLSRDYPSAIDFISPASGAMVLQLGVNAADMLVFFRPQYVTEVKWGGNPEKAAMVTEDGVRLSPRKSFAQWTQTVRNQSRPWSRIDQLVAEFIHSGLLRLLAQRSAQLLRMNEELIRVNSDLDSFAYAASHDLKEPLRTINQTIYFLERALSNNQAQEVRRRIDIIHQTTQRMTDLLEGLLRVSRAGSSDLRLEPTCLEDVVRDAAELSLAHVDGQQIELVVHPLPIAEVDFMCLRDVFQNLFSNARKYSTAQVKRIEVGSVCATSQHDAPTRAAGKTAIYVRDNGIGIATERLKDVFQVFRRLHQPGEYEGGSGVGLAIVKRVVERHGGVVWATSRDGEGSTFYFTLEAIRHDQ